MLEQKNSLEPLASYQDFPLRWVTLASLASLSTETPVAMAFFRQARLCELAHAQFEKPFGRWHPRVQTFLDQVISHQGLRADYEFPFVNPQYIQTPSAPEEKKNDCDLVGENRQKTKGKGGKKSKKKGGRH